MKPLLLATFALTVQAQQADGCYPVTICSKPTPAKQSNWSINGMAGTTTWGLGFYDLQTPGWKSVIGGHPIGLLGVQWKSVYFELSGDPHRKNENSSVFVGLRHDVLHFGRVALYAQVSAGLLEAPSFQEYCWSYEYQNGDCGAGMKPPEICPWFSLNGGGGVRVRLGKHLSLEPARAEYLGVYGIGPRYRFTTGLSYHFGGKK